MKRIKILIYEDDPNWVNAFLEFNIREKLVDMNIQLVYQHMQDDSTIDQDLEWLPQIILIDFDLGGLTGESVIAKINGDPQFTKTSIYFYSGGESVETLKKIASKYKCNIQCFSKDSESLEEALLSKCEREAS